MEGVELGGMIQATRSESRTDSKLSTNCNTICESEHLAGQKLWFAEIEVRDDIDIVCGRPAAHTLDEEH
jgi:hypothetical protein